MCFVSFNYNLILKITPLIISQKSLMRTICSSYFVCCLRKYQLFDLETKKRKKKKKGKKMENNWGVKGFYKNYYIYIYIYIFFFLNCCYIVAPSYFSLFWKACKPLISSDMREKIFICSSKYIYCSYYCLQLRTKFFNNIIIFIFYYDLSTNFVISNYHMYVT